jgi:hypothetical protein
MTPAEQVRVDKLKAKVIELKDRLKAARTKGIAASARGTSKRPAAARGTTKSRPRARARSARGSESAAAS